MERGDSSRQGLRPPTTEMLRGGGQELFAPCSGHIELQRDKAGQEMGKIPQKAIFLLGHSL